MSTKFKIQPLITLIVIFFTVTNLSAQVYTGFKAGANGSTQSEFMAIYDNENIRTGLNIGALVGYTIAENVSLQAEVNYMQKGYKTNSSNVTMNQVSNDICRYFTIPILVKGTTNIDGTNAKFYGVFGPYYGYLLNSKNKMNGEYIKNSDYNKNDAGCSFGVGFSKPVSNLNLFLDLRYDMGLSKISKLDEEIRNKTLSLSVGIYF